MDLGSKVAFGAAATYAVYRFVVKKLFGVHKSQKPQHLKYASKKLHAMHVHCAGGVLVFVVAGALSKPLHKAVEISPKWFIPLAALGVLAKSVKYSARRMKYALWTAFAAGAGVVTTGVIVRGGAKPSRLVTHTALFAGTLTTSALFGFMARAVAPRHHQATAMLVTSTVIGPLLLVVPAQVLALNHAAAVLPADSYVLQSVQSVSPLSRALSMSLAGAAFGAHSASALAFREQHARHFIHRRAERPRADVEDSDSDSEGGSSAGGADDGEGGPHQPQHERKRRSSNAAAVEALTAAADDDGLFAFEPPQVPQRFQELSFELKRELELLVCPAHEARIDSLLARLESTRSWHPRMLARQFAASQPSSSASLSGPSGSAGLSLGGTPTAASLAAASAGAGPPPALLTPASPSMQETERIVSLVQRVNLQCHRETEAVLPNLEGELAGDELDQAMTMFADALFFCVPGALAAIMHRHRAAKRSQYMDARQGGRVRKRQRTQLERLAVLYGLHPPLKPGMRFEYDLEDLYLFTAKHGSAVAADC